MAEGTYYGYSATLHAYRVRDGRFTRMTLRYRRNDSEQTRTWVFRKDSWRGYDWD